VAHVAQTAQPNAAPEVGEVHPTRRPFLSANQGYTRCHVTASTPKPEGAPCVSAAPPDRGGELSSSYRDPRRFMVACEPHIGSGTSVSSLESGICGLPGAVTKVDKPWDARTRSLRSNRSSFS
jgi:hypothetical protein